MAYQYRKFKRAHRDRIEAAQEHPTVGHPAHAPVDVKARRKLLKADVNRPDALLFIPFRYMRVRIHTARS